MNEFDFENGVNGTTGEYLFPRDTTAAIADRARNTAIDKPHLNDLQDRDRAL